MGRGPKSYNNIFQFTKTEYSWHNCLTTQYIKRSLVIYPNDLVITLKQLLAQVRHVRNILHGLFCSPVEYNDTHCNYKHHSLNIIQSTQITQYTNQHKSCLEAILIPGIEIWLFWVLFYNLSFERRLHVLNQTCFVIHIYTRNECVTRCRCRTENCTDVTVAAHRSPISNTVISPDTYNRYLPTSHGFNKILCIHPIESKHRSE